MSTFAYELRHWSQKSCRFHIENKDLEFIKSIFQTQQTLLNETSIQSLINEDNLIKIILESPEQLQISPQLYFYVLLKKAFENSGFYSTTLIDYVVFLLTLHMQSNVSNEDNEFLYISDYLIKMEAVNNCERFYLHVQLANKILILTSLFQEYMQYRIKRKGAPNIQFYEAVASTQYELAMRHPLANELDLKNVFGQLSTSFSSVRQILNQFSERFISLGEPFPGNERFM